MKHISDYIKYWWSRLTHKNKIETFVKRIKIADDLLDPDIVNEYRMHGIGIKKRTRRR